MMAYSYSHLYRLPVTGLRFFTIYGSWGRPDMAIFLFTKAIIEGRPIKLFNHGRMRRDFTHIDDASRIVLRLIDHVPACRAGRGCAGADLQYRQSASRKNLMDVVALLEKQLGRSRRKGYAADAAR